MEEKCAEDCYTKDAATTFTSGNFCTTASPKLGHLSREVPLHTKPFLIIFFLEMAPVKDMILG